MTVYIKWSHYDTLGFVPHRRSPTKIYDTRYRRRKQIEADKLGFQDKREDSSDNWALVDHQALQVIRYSIDENRQIPEY